MQEKVKEKSGDVQVEGAWGAGASYIVGIERKWWVLAAIGVGSFMSALDGSIVNTIQPVLVQHFKSDVASVEWTVTLYLLVVSALLLTFGRLGDLQGYKRMYVSGFFIFVLGSALAGMAPNVPVLIACRGIQAMGAAALFANSPAILTKTFPALQRGQALGMQATMTYLGLTVGPSLGGWLTGQLGWRSVFYINVPVGLVAIVLSWRFILPDAKVGQVERFDWSGALVFMAGLVALLLGLNRGAEWGWNSPRILGLITTAAVLLILFVWLELHCPSPMLDLTLFKSPIFSMAAASAVLNYIALYSILFLLPFYLIRGRGFSPAQAGLVLTAQPIVMAIVAPISGTLSDRIGTRMPAMVGMVILSVGLFLLSRLGPTSPIVQATVALATAGLGTGIFISPNNSALLGAAPPHRRGIASGVLATARNVGMVLGVGLAGAIFTTVLARAPGSTTALFEAVSAGLLTASGVAALGALTSAVRSVAN